MQNENVIDLALYRKQREAAAQEPQSTISDELKTAIQHLIERLRELGPIQQSG